MLNHLHHIQISSSIGLPLAPFTVPCQRRSAHGNILTGVRHSTGTLITPTISSSAKNRSNLTRSSSENILQLQKLSAEEIDKEDSSWTDSHSSLPRHGRMDSCGKYLLLIGSDGAARIYDTEKSVGKSENGVKCDVVWYGMVWFSVVWCGVDRDATPPSTANL